MASILASVLPTGSFDRISVNESVPTTGRRPLRTLCRQISNPGVGEFGCVREADGGGFPQARIRHHNPVGT
jgi:hypothetical protein